MNHQLQFGFYLVIFLEIGDSLGIYSETDPCSRGWFLCGNNDGTNQSKSIVCIHQRKICDFKVDCPDGEDEEQCVDTAGDDDHLNSFLDRLMTPQEDLYKCNLSPLPHYCICKQYTRVTCQHAGLKEVPKALDPNVTHLFLGNNSLVLNQFSFYGYTNLKRLQLDFNSLSVIPNYILQPLSKLKYLSMTYNELETLPCEVFGNSRGIESLILSHNNLTEFEGILNCLPNLTELTLDFNQIQLNRSLASLANHKLQVLFLENNSIKTLSSNSFIGLSQLTSLYLRSNCIRDIQPGAFLHLSNLILLDLTYNLMTVFSANSLNGLESLTTLILAGNPILQFDRDTFNQTPKITSINFEEMELTEDLLHNISSINGSNAYFKRFRYCSYLPHIRDCRPKTDGVSSFDQLLVRTSLRTGVWLVAGITLTGNIIVLLGRSLTREEHKVVSLFIRNLAVADLFTGIYLLVVGIKDLLLRDKYHEFAYDWMSSWHCTISGILALTSCEVSVFILTVMSLERWICISWPLHASLLSLPDAKRIMVLLWVIGIGISITPVVLYRGETRFYGTNGMCFPIHLDDPWMPGWIYSASIIVGLNSFGVIVIIISYTSMFWSIRRTHADTPLSLGNRDLAVRFFFIVITDCLSWIPIITLKIMALVGYDMPADVYAVVVVILLPINSAINPWLYTFTTSKFRNQASNFTFNWASRWKRSDHDSESTRSSHLKCGPYKFRFSNSDRNSGTQPNLSSSGGKSFRGTSSTFGSFPHSILKKKDEERNAVQLVRPVLHTHSDFD